MESRLSVPATEPEVSIVIPVHNEGARLHLTLEALRVSTPVKSEIVVVDDASTDGCCDILRNEPSLFENVLLLESECPQGVAGARNCGARHAHAPVLSFLDAHCFPRPGWLKLLLDCLAWSDVGIATPAIYVAGTPATQGFGMTIVNSDLAVGWLVRGGEAAFEVPVACGCCVALRKPVFDEIGQFEPLKRYGLEDTELSIRCWLSGYRVLVVPRAKVGHCFKSASNFRVDWQDYLYNILRVALLHFEGDRLSRILTAQRSRACFSEAMNSVLAGDIFERAHFLRGLRRHDGEWFCRKFGIDL